jgi:hypothetical protein
MTTTPPQRHIETALSAVICAMLLVWLSSLVVARAQWAESDLQDMLTAASRPVASGAAPVTGWTDPYPWTTIIDFGTNNLGNPLDDKGLGYTNNGATYLLAYTNALQTNDIWSFTTDDYMIGPLYILPAITNWSLSAFVKLRALDTGVVWAQYDEFMLEGRSYLYYDSVSAKWNYFFGSDAVYTNMFLRFSADTPATNIWYHVGVTRSNYVARGYINGVLIATITNNHALSQVRSSIGSRKSAGTFGLCYNGWIDSIGIATGTVLSAADFGTIYTNMHPTNNIRIRP